MDDLFPSFSLISSLCPLFLGRPGVKFGAEEVTVWVSRDFTFVYIEFVYYESPWQLIVPAILSADGTLFPFITPLSEMLQR